MTLEYVPSAGGIITFLNKFILNFMAILCVLCLGEASWAKMNTIGINSTAKDREDISLTIYNSDFGLVREIRSISIPVGRVEMRFMDVASRIDPTSVSFKSLTDPAGLNILEQNYEFGLITPEKLMEKYLGKSVTLVERIKGGEEVMMEAKLLSTSNGYVYQVGDRIHLGHPGRVVLKEIPENLNIRPALTCLLENRQLDEQIVEISYLTRGINWNSDYVVTLDEDGKYVDLTSWVTVTNKTGETYRNAGLKLVAGEIHQVTSPTFKNNYQRSQLKGTAEKTQLDEKPFFDYHLYTLSRSTTIKDNQIKQINLLSAHGIPIRKIYVFEGMPRFYWYRYKQKSIKKIMVKLEIENKQENNLGKPLPAGKIRIYKADPDGGLQLIGEDKIGHTPKGEKILLTAGSAMDMVGEHTQTSFEKLNKNTIKESFQIVINNHREDSVNVTVIEHLAGDWKITESSREWIKKDAGTVEFQLEVPARGKSTIDYTVRVNH